MGRPKADYETLMVQEFLNKEQAMAYTNIKDSKKFDILIHPYVHTYQTSDDRTADYFLPELRKRKLSMVVTTPTM